MAQLFQPCQLKKGGFRNGIAALRRALKTRASRGFEACSSGKILRNVPLRCYAFPVFRDHSQWKYRVQNYRWLMVENQKRKNGLETTENRQRSMPKRLVRNGKV